MIKFLKQYFKELFYPDSKETLALRSIKRYLKKSFPNLYSFGEGSNDWTIFLTATHINYLDQDIPFEVDLGFAQNHWIELPENFMLVGLKHNKTNVKRFLICPTNFRG